MPTKTMMMMMVTKKWSSTVIHICFAYATLSSNNVNFQERVQYCVSTVLLLLSPYTTLITIQILLCFKHATTTHTNSHTAGTDVAIDSIQKAAAASTIHLSCVSMPSVYIFNKTNSTIYQLKRDERIEIECIRVAHKSMHMRGCTTFVWAYVAVEIHTKYK
jgi:hypothetical protein